METTVKTPTVLDYLRCREDLNSLGITDNEILKALKQLDVTVNDLTDRKGYKNYPSYLKNFEVLNDNYWFNTKVYKGEYEKEVRVNGWEVRQSAKYQGLRHGAIIEQILKNKFWWFGQFTKNVIEIVKPLDWRTRLEDLPKDFDSYTVAELREMEKGKEVTKKKSLWKLYEMSNVEHYDIYLTTNLGSLYVPIKALLNKDFEPIKERMISYAHSYHDPKKLSGFALNHRGRTKEEYAKDKQEDYLKMIAPLESEEAKQLFFYFQDTKEYKSQIEDYSIGIKNPDDNARKSVKGGVFSIIPLVEFYYSTDKTLALTWRKDKFSELPIIESRKNYTFQGQATDNFKPSELRGNILVLKK